MAKCKKLNCFSQFAFVKYSLMLLWIISIFIAFCKVYGVYNNELEFFYLRRILGKSLCISRVSGVIINISIICIMLPVCPTFNRLIHQLLYRISTDCLTFYLEKLKILHITFTIGLILVTIIHGVSQIINIVNFIKYFDEDFADINWANGKDDSLYRLLFATPTGFSGCAMFFLLITIWMFSTEKMRKRYYNTFLASHHLFIPFLALMYYHPLSHIFKYQNNINDHFPGCNANSSSMCTEPPQFSPVENYSYVYPTIALAIFLIDATIRYVRRNSNKIVVLESLQFPGEAVFLRFKMSGKPFNVLPTQYILLQCLDISVLEWHPFTISNCPTKDDESFTLLIGVRGDWTSELYRKIVDYNSRKTYITFSEWSGQKIVHKNKKLKFLIDGPFPSPLENIFHKKITVCVAGGVGVTPFIAALNELLRNNRKKPLRMHLIWVVKKLEQILWFSEVFEKLLEKFWRENQPDRLEIQIYIKNNYNLNRIADLFYSKDSFLKSRIHNGKPCWNTYFDYLIFLYKKYPVNVFCSGPKSLVRSIRSVCNDNNKNGYNFSLVQEAFN